MRHFLVITLAASVCGCAFLDNLDLAAPRLDPTLIYLQHESITVEHRHELDRYACLRGVLLCDEKAGLWDCYCF